MRLVKDTSDGGRAIQVPCIGANHAKPSRMFTLAEGYADLDGEAFVAYYCDECALAEVVKR